MSQGIFVNVLFLAYLISPAYVHRFVGYLEEEAVKSKLSPFFFTASNLLVAYTHILEELDAGHLPLWKDMDAPPIAVKYWRLGEKAKMRDVILAIRSDEAHHRQVNHTFGKCKRMSGRKNSGGF